MKKGSVLLAIVAVGVLSLPLVTRAQLISDQQADGVTCDISAIEEAEIPAEEAGKIVLLPVTDGSIVKKGELLARIDDSQPVLQKRAAEFAMHGAAEKAKDDIDVQHAIAAAKVAEKEEERLRNSRSDFKGSVSATDYEKAKLEAVRANLAIKRAQRDLVIAGFEASSKGVEVEGADNSIARRKITAPFEGEVVQLRVHTGEWVKPGDTVMRLVRFDRLRVHAFLPASEYDHTNLLGKSVQVNVELPGGKVFPATGKITYVAPIVQGGRFTVQAEILNKQLGNGRWLVQPGSRGRLTIDGAVASAPSTTSFRP